MSLIKILLSRNRLDLAVKNRTLAVTFVVIVVFAVLLAACTNDPDATIREVTKTESQVTISVFLEDPSDTVDYVDVAIIDDTRELSSTGQIKKDDTLEGLWDVTLPMVEVDAGSYEIVVEATVSNDDTIVLVTESIAWP